MDDTSVDIRLRLRDAKRFNQDASGSAKAVRKIGDEAGKASRKARSASTAFDGLSGRLGNVTRAAGLAGTATGGIFALGIKQGLTFNAQVENSVARFRLFTKNQGQANKLLQSVQQINKSSTYDLGSLADAAAYLGNSGVKVGSVATGVQAIANAASAAGGGNDRLSRIAIAIGQIQAGGTLAKEDINQLTEAGVNVGPILRKTFKLTAKEYKNLGDQGIDSNKAIKVLFDYFTSGKLAEAAKRQTQTFNGQIDLLKDNVNSTLGLLTKPLFNRLRSNLLPALNSSFRKIDWTKPLNDQVAFLNLKGIIIGEVQGAWTWFRTSGGPALGRAFSTAVRVATPAIGKAFGAVAPIALNAFWDAAKTSPVPTAAGLALILFGPKKLITGVGALLWKGISSGFKRGGKLPLPGAGKGAGGLGGVRILNKLPAEAIPVYVVRGGGGGKGLPPVIAPVPAREGWLKRLMTRARNAGGALAGGAGSVWRGAKGLLGKGRGLVSNPFIALADKDGPVGAISRFLTRKRGLGAVGQLLGKGVGWPLGVGMAGWDLAHGQNLFQSLFGFGSNPAAAQKARQQAARAAGGATRKQYFDPAGFPISAQEYRRHSGDGGYSVMGAGNTIIKVVMPNGKVLAETVLEESRKHKRRK